jgi:hypothetical protein
MEEKEIQCETCALLRKLSDDGKYYKNQRPEKMDKWITICKSSIVAEDYYKDEDGKLEYGGRSSYQSRPINFCPECGRKIDESELTW